MSIENAYIKRWLGVHRETNPLCYFIGTIHQSDLQILWVFLYRSSHFHLFFRSVVDFLSHTWRNRDLLSAFFVYTVGSHTPCALVPDEKDPKSNGKKSNENGMEAKSRETFKRKITVLNLIWSVSFHFPSPSEHERNERRSRKKKASFCFLLCLRRYLWGWTFHFITK